MKQKIEILQTVLSIIQFQLAGEIYQYDYNTEREEMKQLRYEATNCMQEILHNLDESWLTALAFNNECALDEFIRNVRELDCHYEYGIFDTFTGAMPSIN